MMDLPTCRCATARRRLRSGLHAPATGLLALATAFMLSGVTQAADWSEASAIRAFCIDFNWGEGGPNAFAKPGLWADASPEEHVAWYAALGCNTIQTFAVSCNGYAWYQGGPVPPQPGLKHDFLTAVVKLGHGRGMRVMGYFCVGANTLWGQTHSALSYDAPSAPHIPFTTEYLDYLCASIEDALRRTDMDGFMIDWVWNPGDLDGAPLRWLDCEQQMYREFFGEAFPGKEKVTPERELEFRRRAIDRCWERIHTAAKRAKPDCVIWLSCCNVSAPVVVNSRLFKEVDWLMNEATDPKSLEQVESMKGAHTRLVQCVVGWGDKHDARGILSSTAGRNLGIYGFAKPGPNSLPLPVAQYRERPIDSFQGNDRNIAVLARAFKDLPLESVSSLYCSSAADNDLLRVLTQNGIDVQRFDSPQAAIETAGEGAGVLLLADGYPAKTTPLDAALFDMAARKRLRLYVEYPSFLPGVEIGAPRGTQWERAVIASDAFGPALARLRILAIHGCHCVPLQAENPHIVIGRVAGFDTAVFGLAKESCPILYELPASDRSGAVLVATTKLSQFVTGRYAPHAAWQSVWDYVVTWLQPGREVPPLAWTATVRPSFRAEDALPPDAEQQAIQRGIDWYFNARMVIHPSMMPQYNRPANRPEPGPAEPDLQQDWPFGHRIARMPDLSTPPGDGSLGVMEGFDARIFPDGTQPARWWIRNDCNGEIAGAMALSGRAIERPAYLQTGGNVGEWLYFTSMMSLGDRADPEHPAYGLMGWNDSPQYCGPGSMDGYAVYYGDDNARSMLGMMLAAAALKTDRYDERLLKCLLANVRISGRLGFQPDRVDQGPLEQAGWQQYFCSKNVSYSPHYQATTWACYLWAYRQTGFKLFLERAKTAIGMTMAAYPDRWVWTNGIQQERAKMMLPLAWLVRVEDTPEHRAWLRRIAEDLLAAQDPCGAIREQIGEAGKGGFPPPASNEAYGTAEAPLIQSNSDAACDLLYTTNFAFLALHEAAAATDDPFYRTAEEKLASFLCRIQVRSESHPELDGGWFRAFDFRRWEYWASSTDAGWGAWSIESGWTQSWIVSVLALRHLKTSMWEFTSASGVARHMDTLRPLMLPDDVLSLKGVSVKHVGVFLPTTVEFAVSREGTVFETVASVEPDVPPRESGPLARVLETDTKGVAGRFVRVTAKNLGVIPAWQVRAPSAPAWLFCDEIIINPKP